MKNRLKFSKKWLLILAMILEITSLAQDSKLYNQANSHYQEYEFQKAIQEFEKIGDKTDDIYRKLADCYRKTNNPQKSEENYLALIGLGNPLPDDIYNYAYVLRENKKYEESNRWMIKFHDLSKEDSRGNESIESKNLISSLLKDEHIYKVYTLNINSEEEDFSPSYYGNHKIVFTSSRKDKNRSKTWGWNGLPFLNMYQADIDKDFQIVNPAIFEPKFNGKYHDGPASFANDGNYVVFTRNNYDEESKDGERKLELFHAEKKDGVWSEEEVFPFDNSEYSVGHSTLSPDGKVMYFASDMPEGHGESDIYIVKKKSDGSWTNPKNLGNKINTEGNEVFPFYHQEGYLVFSSDGHFGLGGLDLFIVKLDSLGEPLLMQNMGTPINSNLDDFGLIMNNDMSGGYFSSNREGGVGSDDIYGYKIEKNISFNTVLKGTAVDEQRRPLENVKIVLKTKRGDFIQEITTSENGKYSFLVKTGSQYQLSGKKIDYNQAENHVSTEKIQSVYWSDLVLFMPDILVENSNRKSDININAKAIQFDYDDFKITKNAQKELDKVVELMNENIELKIEIKAYTDCRGSDIYNQRLSEKRAKSVLLYIQQKIKNPENIVGNGYGEQAPLHICNCDNYKDVCSEEQHFENRRVEFYIK